MAPEIILKGGERTLAISKKRKDELVEFYTEQLGRSQALIVTEYLGLNMKQIDELRSKCVRLAVSFTL